MAFLEQFGKKVSDVSGEVAQQTKKIADIARLNSLISENEKRIVQLYTVIGQLYYEKHMDDLMADELEKIKEISNLREEIKKQQEEIKQIKGIAKCANCGADVSIEAVFCNICGARMTQGGQDERAAVSEGEVCPKCHSSVRAGNLFCSNCGFKL